MTYRSIYIASMQGHTFDAGHKMVRVIPEYLPKSPAVFFIEIRKWLLPDLSHDHTAAPAAGIVKDIRHCTTTIRPGIYVYRMGTRR